MTGSVLAHIVLTVCLFHRPGVCMDVEREYTVLRTSMVVADSCLDLVAQEVRLWDGVAEITGVRCWYGQ